VFFDHLNIPWRYEHQGYDLGEEGPYLPDFLLYPDTPTAMWFEVKGKLPDSSELAKAQAPSTGTGLPAFVYFAELAIPAPEHLEMTYEEFVGHQDMWMWDDLDGWIASPSGPARWEVGLRPTAFRFNPRGPVRPGKPRSGFRWWTDCPYCGQAVLKYRGQVGWCPIFDDDHEPPEPQYPASPTRPTACKLPIPPPARPGSSTARTAASASSEKPPLIGLPFNPGPILPDPDVASLCQFRAESGIPALTARVIGAATASSAWASSNTRSRSAIWMSGSPRLTWAAARLASAANASSSPNSRKDLQ
jgi:hypothetical protein